MQAFQAILLILLGAVVLVSVAERIGAPYPALLAMVGALLAIFHVQVPFRLDPHLALALFVAPILLDAAYDTSIRDLKRSWQPILGLVLFAVGLTTTAVACIAHLLKPDLPWAAAIALGAIVAPPDAAAANAVFKSLPLPHRLRTVLDGESLLNDASALLIYRLAVTAVATGGSVSAQAIAPAFLLSGVGSVVAGPVIAYSWTRVTRHVTDPAGSTILQFLSTFGIWTVADALSLSPILTVVSYAITVAQFAPATTPASIRVPAYAVWDTAVIVLNALAFSMIGLELARILTRASSVELGEWLWFGGAILLTVIVIRLLWTASYALWVRVSGVRAGIDLPPGIDAPTWRGSAVIGWSGMRGIVTVATALALPLDFPQRELMLFTAFAVTLGTLVVQGLTLRPLLKVLALKDDGQIDAEVRQARVALADAGVAALDGDDSQEAVLLRDELSEERDVARTATDGDGRPVLAIKRLHARILEVRREKLLALRRDGDIGDDAFHVLEEELDLADLAVAQRT